MVKKLKGKRILVTGGTGFVGSHLVELLLKDKHTIIVLKRSSNPLSYFNQNKLSQKVILANCDLKNKDRVFDVVSKYEVDYIFHLGAQAIVTTAFTNPVEAIKTNVIGTTHILEAARLSPLVKGIVVASSDKAYGKSSKEYTENDPMAGDHPYEVSKSCTDLIARTYAKTYDLPVSVARCGNIYGEGDLNLSRIIPGMIKSIFDKELLELRSDGSFIRDYVYVKDVALAYRFLLQQLDKTRGDAFNICSNDSCSVLNLIEIARKTLRRKIPYKILNNQKNEIPIQHLNDLKIRRLGWKPKYTLKSTLPRIYKWYENVLS